MGSWDAFTESMMNGDMESLVGQIKDMQRSDPEAREQWATFTQQGGGGRLDPAKHDATFLQAFVVQYTSGARLPVNPPAGAAVDNGTGTGDGGLAELVKTLQRKNPTFKNMWSNFCLAFGGGRQDPLKHDNVFHLKFLETLAEQAAGLEVTMEADPAMPGMGMGEAEPPSKRARGGDGGYWGGNDGSWGGGSVQPGSQKAVLVERVRAFMRMGADPKELWELYADTYLAGVRDPARHDEETLTEFCTNHNAPEVAAAAGGGGGGGGGVGWGSAAGGGGAAAGAYGGAAAAGAYGGAAAAGAYGGAGAYGAAYGAAYGGGGGAYGAAYAAYGGGGAYGGGCGAYGGL